MLSTHYKTMLVSAVLLLCGQADASTVSSLEEREIEFIVVTPGLRLREAPSSEGTVLKKLDQGAMLVPLGNVSDYTERHQLNAPPGVHPQMPTIQGNPISWEVESPWIHVRAPDGNEGWVYGGGLSPPYLPFANLDGVFILGGNEAGDLAVAYYNPGSCEGWHTVALLDRYGEKVPFVYNDEAENLAVYHLPRVGRWVPNPVSLSDQGALGMFLADRGLRRVWQPRVLSHIETPSGSVHIRMTQYDPLQVGASGDFEVELVGSVGGHRLGIAAGNEDWRHSGEAIHSEVRILEPGPGWQRMGALFSGNRPNEGARFFSTFPIPPQLAQRVASGELARDARARQFDLVYDRFRLLVLLAMPYTGVSREPGVRRLAETWPSSCAVSWQLPRATEPTSMHVHRDGLIRSFNFSGAVPRLFSRGIELIDAETYLRAGVEGDLPQLQERLNEILGEKLILGIRPLRLSRPVVEELLSRFDPRPGQELLGQSIEDMYCLYRRDVRRMIRVHRAIHAAPGREAALNAYREIIEDDGHSETPERFAASFMLEHGIDLRAGTFTSEEHSAADVAFWLHWMNEEIDDLILAALERVAKRLDPGFLESAGPADTIPAVRSFSVDKEELELVSRWIEEDDSGNLTIRHSWDSTDGLGISYGPRPDHPTWPGDYDLDFPTTERCIPFELNHFTGSTTWPNPPKALFVREEEISRLIQSGIDAFQNRDIKTLISLLEQGLSPWHVGLRSLVVAAVDPYGGGLEALEVLLSRVSDPMSFIAIHGLFEQSLSTCNVALYRLLRAAATGAEARFHVPTAALLQGLRSEHATRCLHIVIEEGVDLSILDQWEINALFESAEQRYEGQLPQIWHELALRWPPVQVPSDFPRHCVAADKDACLAKSSSLGLDPVYANGRCCVRAGFQCVPGTEAACEGDQRFWTGSMCCIRDQNRTRRCHEMENPICDEIPGHVWTGSHCCAHAGQQPVPATPQMCGMLRGRFLEGRCWGLASSSQCFEATRDQCPAGQNPLSGGSFRGVRFTGSHCCLDTSWACAPGSEGVCLGLGRLDKVAGALWIGKETCCLARPRRSKPFYCSSMSHDDCRQALGLWTGEACCVAE